VRLMPLFALVVAQRIHQALDDWNIRRARDSGRIRACLEADRCTCRSRIPSQRDPLIHLLSSQLFSLQAGPCFQLGIVVISRNVSALWVLRYYGHAARERPQEFDHTSGPISFTLFEAQLPVAVISHLTYENNKSRQASLCDPLAMSRVVELSLSDEASTQTCRSKLLVRLHDHALPYNDQLHL
jgi:hypothetical protein